MWATLIPVLGSLLDKLIPDQQAAAAAKLKLIELEQQGQLKELDVMSELSKAQMAVNQAEAASEGNYKGGWRPAIGYVLAFCLGYNYILNPLLLWSCAIWYPEVTPPKLDLDDNMWELMFGMLGLAGWRSWDKKKK